MSLQGWAGKFKTKIDTTWELKYEEMLKINKKKFNTKI